MESPITMGEAGDNVCKEKTKHVDDGACVNGDINCDEQMEVCEIDSKAPEVNSNNIDSLKNCEKVPANKVPIETVNDDDDDDDEPMEVDMPTSEKENCISDDDEDVVDTEISKKRSQNNGTKNHDDKEEGGAVNGESSENSVNGTTIILDDSKSENDKLKSDSEQLNDSGDVVLIENDSEHKENGDVCSSPDVEEIINISDKDVSKENNETISLVSPLSKKKPKKQSAERLSDVTPRRSSRNLNKQKSYVEKDAAEEQPRPVKQDDAESDIEEITPEDPLAVTVVRETKEDKKKSKQTSASSSSTIVVSDTKRLVEIAANSKPTSTTGKKEPTLVIIDTNSILSGRGPVPVTSHKSNQMSASFSMVPVALPAQGVYPPNMRATITPIPMASSTPAKQSSTVASISAVSAIVPSLAVSSASVTPAAPILPTLTDDMYVVEAPSFIVPYVYEKPPIKPFKEFVTQIHKEIKELARKEAEKMKNKKKEADDDDDDDDDDDEDTEKTNKKNDDAKSECSDKNEDEKKKDDSSKKDDSDEDYEEKISKVKEARKKDDNIKTIDLDDIPDEKTDIVKPKSSSYFDNALGQFFINIGYGLVQEYVQTDLLKQQKRKQKSEGTAPETKMAINSLIKNLEYSKENNEPYKMEQKRCEFCSFKTESALVLAHHLETPHMRNYVYKCNFCTTEVRSPHDILFHMEAEHNTRGRLERAPAFHQCPNCPFEDNQKGKLSRHLVTCLKKFKPESNLSPPVDWEPPAKIPRVPRMKQQGLQATAATYQALAQAKGNYQLFSKLQQASSPQAFPRGRGRPSLMGKVSPIRPQTPIIRTNMMYRPGAAGGSVLVPTTYQFGGNQIFQVVGGGQSELGAGGRLSATSTPVALVPNLVSAQSTVTIQNSSGNKTSGKVVQQPSISITPLPRQSSGSSTTITKTSGSGGGTPSVSVTAGESSSSKATFVICEICDGYIKDLEQLRNHMQWIHKVKIHPKMIYNRPPLNCQKCQFRFFTDQGLERHLLGSHGLVTSSMQEAANKSKDAGRCPVCGRVYQWKLLNHVARDHNMTLKPAHLSYKCTVCTATFGMYKQFENHVYSAHSVVAKRVMDKKSSPSTTTSSSSAASSGATISARGGGANDSLLKPLKINDEITIIPQPAKSSKTTTSSSSSNTKSSNANNDRGK